MKKLIIARHGSYGVATDDGCKFDLNDLGRKQIDVLAKEIKKHVEGNSVVILSSTSPRAEQSAEIIGELLGFEYQTNDILTSDRQNHYNPDKTLDLVRQHQDIAEIIILVTHLECGKSFPEYFGKKELGIARLNSCGFLTGHALVIDCVNKTITGITPTL